MKEDAPVLHPPFCIKLTDSHRILKVVDIFRFNTILHLNRYDSTSFFVDIVSRLVFLV